MTNDDQLTQLNIEMDEGFGINGIFPRKIISINGKSAPTPGVAIPIDRLDDDQPEVHGQSRKINEVHITVNDEKISKELSSDSGPISKDIENAMESANDDEITIIFTKYNETITLEYGEDTSEKVPLRLTPKAAKCIVNTVAEYSDILPVPMFPDLAYVTNEDVGVEDPFYENYLVSVVTFLNHAEKYAPNKSIMGVLSARFSWECLENLFDIYDVFEVRAFNFNLDRLKFTADDQLAKVDEMMEYIVDEEMEDKSLFYLMNPARGNIDSDINALPAADLAAFGYGFDIIGSRRVSKRMDYSEITPNPNLFYLFDRDEYIYRSTKLRNLESHFPDETAFEVEEVVRLCRKSPKKLRYQLQALINAEQLSLSAMDFRKQEEGEAAYRYLRKKLGVTPDILDDMYDLRKTFDNAIAMREQTKLGDFEAT